MVCKFIIVLLYDVIMRISTVYPSMCSTLPDIKHYGTASYVCVCVCVCVCLWNCADTRTSTLCLLQSVLDNIPVWLVYRAHNTQYHLIYFILFYNKRQLNYVIFNLYPYTDNGFIRFLSHISFRYESLMTALDGRNM